MQHTDKTTLTEQERQGKARSERETEREREKEREREGEREKPFKITGTHCPFKARSNLKVIRRLPLLSAPSPAQYICEQ